MGVIPEIASIALKLLGKLDGRNNAPPFASRGEMWITS
jgi:hypothetical protein